MSASIGTSSFRWCLMQGRQLLQTMDNAVQGSCHVEVRHTWMIALIWQQRVAEHPVNSPLIIGGSEWMVKKRQAQII